MIALRELDDATLCKVTYIALCDNEPGQVQVSECRYCGASFEYVKIKQTRRVCDACMKTHRNHGTYKPLTGAPPTWVRYIGGEHEFYRHGAYYLRGYAAEDVLAGLVTWDAFDDRAVKAFDPYKV